MPLPDEQLAKLQKLAEKFGPPEDYEISLNDNDEPAEDAEDMDTARAIGASVRKVTDALFDDATAPDVDQEPIEVRLTVVQGGKSEEDLEPEYLPEKLLVWVQIGKWEGRYRTAEFSTEEPVPVLAKKEIGFGAAVEDALNIIINKVKESEKPKQDAKSSVSE